MFSQQIVKNDAFLHDIFTYPSSLRKDVKALMA